MPDDVSFPAAHPKPGLFYGYWIILAGFFCMFVYACTFYCFSLFVTPIEAAFGWSRASIMAGFTIFYLIFSVAAPLAGRMVDRNGARPVITAGAVISGIGFILLCTWMHSLWQFYLYWAILGIGNAALAYISVNTVVAQWFVERRGLAIGIVSSGLGFGGFVMSPVLGGYIIPSFGWQTGYLVLGLLSSVLIIPLALFVIRTRPQDIGLKPYGYKKQHFANASSSASGEGMTLKTALITPTFWLIAVSFFLFNFSITALFQNQTPYLQDIGFTIAHAASILGVTALVSIAGKFLFGFLCDQIQPKFAAALGIFSFSLCIILFLNISLSAWPGIAWIYAVLLGFSIGMWLPTLSMIVGRSFGLKAYGTIFGIYAFVMGLSSSIGPVVISFLYDSFQSYDIAFYMLLILNSVAVPLVLLAKSGKYI